MCRVPDPEDAKYKDDEDAYEDDLEEMQTKTDKIKPKTFPYTFYLMDEKQEKAYDEEIFSNYKGAVYWNDCGRDFIVDPNQPKENFEPENMQIQMREIDGEEAVTIVFYAGPEQ